MKVAKLIEKLMEFDGNLDVIISGYEGGFGDIVCLNETEIYRCVNDAWYYGPHEEAKYCNKNLVKGKKKTKAVILN